jgi:hypothetical protein
MIYSSLAILALSASAAVNPFTNLVHLHPRPAQPDTRISLKIHNNGISFCDVRIDGHTYTVGEHKTVTVKAPAGTVIYADSRTPQYRRGDAIVAITPELNDHQIDLK